MDKGWISIHRKIVENPYYFSEPFTKIQAWIDMIIIANHKPGTFFKRGIKVGVKRGQIGYDLDSLAKRWMWSRGKVERYLNVLENEKQITRQKTNVTTLISITKYDDYQKIVTQTTTQTVKQATTQTEKQTVKQTDTNNNDNKDNNENNEEQSSVSDSVEVPSTSPTQNFNSFGKQPIENLKKNCAGHSTWLESIGMKNSLSMEQVVEWFEAFCLHLVASGKTEETEQEFKRYCASWIASEVRQGRKPITTAPPDKKQKTDPTTAFQDALIKKHGSRYYQT